MPARTDMPPTFTTDREGIPSRESSDGRFTNFSDHLPAFRPNFTVDPATIATESVTKGPDQALVQADPGRLGGHEAVIRLKMRRRRMS